jgi:chromate transporter
MQSRVGSSTSMDPGSVGEVFAIFLKLGLTSFGGPIAHLGHFQRELVERRRWLDTAHYAQLVAICQALPGPASSQLGFALGMTRAGWRGAIAAFVAFTAPSVCLLLVFTRLLERLDDRVWSVILHGVKLLAVAVVAQALVGMVRQLAPDWSRRLIALAVAAVLVVSDGAMHIPVLVFGAACGLLFCHGVQPDTGGVPACAVSPRASTVLLVLFAALLGVSLLAAAAPSPLVKLAAALYRSGALVFGGGHVVLPLLQDAVVTPGWVGRDEFVAAYGAAQVVPGPMFSVAALFGASVEPALGGVVGAGVAVLAIFLPGLLLVAGVLPRWHAIAHNAGAMRALAGVNAAVTGLVAAALYDPVWTSAIHSLVDLGIAAVAFLLLTTLRVPVLWVVAWCVVAAALGSANDWY